MTARRPACWLWMLTLALAGAWAVAPAVAAIDLQDRLGHLEVESEGEAVYIVVPADPEPIRLTPDQFAQQLQEAHEAQRRQGWVFVLFNISGWSGLCWVSLGFLGQALFTARMLLQWLASEKQQRSVVPVGFWWGSLLGGLMLLVYFIWRRDIVGIVGQSTGAFIYARNLLLIYRPSAPEPTPATGSK